MCPDRELLSAYIDGEVPSPWRERIAEHLSSCPACARIAELYAELGRAMRADELPGEEASLARVRARLEGDLARAEAPASRGGASIPAEVDAPIWRRSVRLPLPLAAAAAVLVLALGGAATTLALGPRAQSPSFALVGGQSSPEIVSTPVISSPSAQPSSMEELLRYLDAHDAQVTITMNIPSGTLFDESGEPVIIRASQEPRGRSP